MFCISLDQRVLKSRPSELIAFDLDVFFLKNSRGLARCFITVIILLTLFIEDNMRQSVR